MARRWGGRIGLAVALLLWGLGSSGCSSWRVGGSAGVGGGGVNAGGAFWRLTPQQQSAEEAVRPSPERPLSSSAVSNASNE